MLIIQGLFSTWGHYMFSFWNSVKLKHAVHDITQKQKEKHLTVWTLRPLAFFSTSFLIHELTTYLGTWRTDAAPSTTPPHPLPHSPPPKQVQNRLIQPKSISTISPVNTSVSLMVCEVCIRIGNLVMCLYWHSSWKYLPHLSLSLLEGLISGVISFRKEDLHYSSLCQIAKSHRHSYSR